MPWGIIAVIFISCLFALGLSGCLLNAYYMQKKQKVISNEDWQSYMAFAWTAMGAGIVITVSTVAYVAIKAKSRLSGGSEVN